MPEPSKPNLNYVCPHCGQPAVAGNHFCEKTTAQAAPPKAPSQKKPRNQAGSVAVLVAAGVAIIVLWRFVGPASLVLAALGLLGLLYWRASQKK